MEWWQLLLVMFGALVALMLIGFPVALSFLVVAAVGAYQLWGGLIGLEQLITSLFTSLSHFSLVAVILFILMGEVMFQSGLAPRMLTAVDMWIGRVPGRLGLVAVSSGALFASMSGSSMSSTAVLGSLLLPEMEKRGYRKPMSLGPILGSGGLSIMIPPTALGIILAILAKVSVGKLLVAIVVPGLLMALFYALYIVIRAHFQPWLAPPYAVRSHPMPEKLWATVKYILPLGAIVFLVLGLIFLGVVTPTEAAAMGTAGSFVLAACFGRLDWQVVRSTLSNTLQTSAMVLFILAGALVFSQVLAFSGATRGLVGFIVGLDLSPLLLLIVLQLVLLVMGCFMENLAIMTITVPIFMPITASLGIDPVWFCVIVLLNMEMAAVSPPFGLSLFVMKAVAPADTTMGQLYRATLPFLACDALVMLLIIVYPPTAMWLVGQMQ
jgi:tripartite ATP-independent transporter DctM subunit